MTSAYFGRDWTTKRQDLDKTVEKLERQLEEAQSADKFLQNRLRPDSTNVVLAKAVPQVMLEIFNKRVEYGVTLGFAAPAKLSTGAISTLDVLSEAVPGTKVKSVRINLSGTYQTYQGLLGYLSSLRGLPVAIVRLKIQEQSFEAALRVYGNEK